MSTGSDTYHGDFMLMYYETVQPLFDFVSRRSGNNRDLAEDVTQETFLRAVTQWRAGSIPNNPIAWLQCVARNLLINHFERRSPGTIDPGVLDQILESTQTPTMDTAAIIQMGLAKMGRTKTELLEAYYFDGKAVGAIADELKISERAVEGRLRRSRRTLRKHLAGYLDISGGAA